MHEMTRDSDGTLHVPARRIPLPPTISAEAQLALSAPRFEALKEPPAHDKAAWRRHIAEADARMAKMLAPLAEKFPVQVDTHSVGAATLYEITPPEIPARNARRAILHVHGGGYVMGGGRLAGQMAVSMATAARMKTFSIDYRMPPDHPFPTGLEDCLAAYRWVTERHETANVAVGGASAGGGLSASLILKIRDVGLPLPGAAFIITPESDLTESGDSFQTNRLLDVVLSGPLPQSIRLYANGHDLEDPYLSANFGDFSKGYPPTILVTGTRDLFLSNTVILHRALRRAGISADLHVFEAMPHGGFFGAPEDQEAMDEQVRFLDRHLGTA